MYKQSAYFGTMALYRSVDLAGPAAASRGFRRAEQNEAALGGMRRPDKAMAKLAGYDHVHQSLSVLFSKFMSWLKSSFWLIRAYSAQVGIWVK